MNLTSHLFSFRGRINLAKYWLATLISTVGGMVLLMIATDALADALRGANPERIAKLFPILFYAITCPICAVLLWTLAATTIKRLRDRDRSGWWIVPFMVLPIALPQIGHWIGEPSTSFLLQLAGFVLSIWGFVELFCLMGTRGPNRFGPDPRVWADSGHPAVSHGIA